MVNGDDPLLIVLMILVYYDQHELLQAIKDSLLVLSSTQRYRKKYVTTILYKPIS